MRHSRDPQGPMLSFSHSEWEAFLTGVRDGEFDTAAPGSRQAAGQQLVIVA
jgi:hypothetical protein